MKAEVIKIPNRFLPAIHRTEKCAVVRLPVVHIEQECPKVQELRRHCKLWLERDREFSGGTCSGGEHL